MSLELDYHGAALPQVLAAVYAAGKLSYASRPAVFHLIRRATRWEGEDDERLVAYLTGDDAAFRPWMTPEHDGRWALDVFGFGAGEEPTRGDVIAEFRRLVRTAHPDHGASAEGAGLRISELTQAKRILLRAAEAE
jgi:hypothetical protein